MRSYQLVPAAAVIGALALAGGAKANATVTPFSESNNESFQVTDPCRGDLAGVEYDSFVITGEMVGTPAGDGYGGLNEIHGTVSGTTQTTYEDGSYALGSFSSPFEFGGPFLPPHAIEFRSTATLVAKLTVYDASGQQIGTETVHWLLHLAATINGLPVDIDYTYDDPHVVTCGG